MLNEIDTGVYGQPQAVDGGGMGLGHTVPPMRFFHDRTLCLGREPDEGGPGEMRGPPILEKVGTLVEIRANRGAELLRVHVHQVFAHALGVPAVLTSFSGHAEPSFKYDDYMSVFGRRAQFSALDDTAVLGGDRNVEARKAEDAAAIAALVPGVVDSMREAAQQLPR